MNEKEDEGEAAERKQKKVEEEKEQGSSCKMMILGIEVLVGSTERTGNGKMRNLSTGWRRSRTYERVLGYLLARAQVKHT